jgi:hypothetical protein
MRREGVQKSKKVTATAGITDGGCFSGSVSGRALLESD